MCNLAKQFLNWSVIVYMLGSISNSDKFGQIEFLKYTTKSMNVELLNNIHAFL